jgi:hypothetical protein
MSNKHIIACPNVGETSKASSAIQQVRYASRPQAIKSRNLQTKFQNNKIPSVNSKFQPSGNHDDGSQSNQTPRASSPTSTNQHRYLQVRRTRITCPDDQSTSKDAQQIYASLGLTSMERWSQETWQEGPWNIVASIKVRRELEQMVTK